MNRPSTERPPQRPRGGQEPPPTTPPPAPAALAVNSASGIEAAPVFGFADILGTMEPNLYEIELPEGDVGSISVSWINGGADNIFDHREWLGKTGPDGRPYEGVRFAGKGVGKTIIRQGGAWDSVTFAVGPHNGIVEIEGVTIHAGYPDKGRAIHFGTSLKRDRKDSAGNPIELPINPNFQLRLIDVDLIADDPSEPHMVAEREDPTKAVRSTWLVFTYQADTYFKRVRFFGKNLSEHACYRHGVAQHGLLAEDCYYEAGAEGDKTRSDHRETHWPGAQVSFVYRRCVFNGIGEEHSWRGSGSGITIQGGAAHVLISDCVFRGQPANAKYSAGKRARAISISAEGDSHDVLTGKVNQGYGNGYVLIVRCLMEGAAPANSDYLDEVINIGTWGGSQIACMGALLKDSGAWGEFLTVKLDGGNTPYFGILGCNRPEVAQYARAEHGFTAGPEAIYFANGRIPVSNDRQIAASKDDPTPTGGRR